MRWWIVGVWSAVAACAVDIGDTKDDDPLPSDSPPVETDPPEVDTAPLPPCAVPEVEPNDSPDAATVLPTDARGCGGFGTRNDADRWRFTLAEEAWLGVRIDAFTLGSLADVQLTLTSDDADVVLGAFDMPELPDIDLRFPAQPGTYDAVVLQERGVGKNPGEGDDFFYEILATSTKPPFDWDVDEDPDAATQALTLLPGRSQTVFGGFQASSDSDTFSFTVPNGTQVLSLAGLARNLGSSADIAVEVIDVDGTSLGIFRRGPLPVDPDPVGEVYLTSPGTATVEVTKEGDPLQAGAEYWYGLSLTLEPR